MKDIVICGAGGLGREAALLLHQINIKSSEWNLRGFYDDALNKGTSIDNLEVIGGVHDLNKVMEPLSVVVAISDSASRKAVVSRINNPRIQFPVIFHPSCQPGDDGNHFGKGCILTAGVILTTGIHLEDFVILNLAATVGHDVRIGEFSSIMPGCSISGNVKIGECTLMGTGARILQNLSIGSNCKIGAGAVVTQHFGDGKTIVGVPAYEK